MGYRLQGHIQRPRKHQCTDSAPEHFSASRKKSQITQIRGQGNQRDFNGKQNAANLVKRCRFIDNEGLDFENQYINLIFVRLYEVNGLPEPDINTPPIDRCCWLLANLPDMNTEPSPEVVGEFGDIVEAATIAGFSKDKKRQWFGPYIFPLKLSIVLTSPSTAPAGILSTPNALLIFAFEET